MKASHTTFLLLVLCVFNNISIFLNTELALSTRVTIFFSTSFEKQLNIYPSRVKCSTDLEVKNAGERRTWVLMGCNENTKRYKLLVLLSIIITNKTCVQRNAMLQVDVYTVKMYLVYFQHEDEHYQLLTLHPFCLSYLGAENLAC